MTQKPPVQKLHPDQHAIPDISDKQVELVGRTIVLWSKLEAALDDTIWLLLGIHDEDGKIITRRMGADAKIQMLRTLGERKISNQELLTSFNENLTLIGELKDGRNFIAHGVWGTLMPDNIPIALSLKPKSEIGEVVSESFPVERMEAIISGIRRTLDQLVNLPEALGIPRRVPE
ncbi:MAG: hypothetical protein V3V13_00025 [Paracoccaceae bacterium]